MGIEIERRFLVKNEDWTSKAILSKNIRQGYLSSDLDNWIVRVRVVDKNHGFITLKSSLNGLINHEFEYQIPISDAIELLNLSKDKLSKTRYQLIIDGKDWIVDSFEDLNSSLTIAEIELKSDSEEVSIPSWCGEEITGNKFLSNAYLAKTPISILSLKDRMESKDL